MKHTNPNRQLLLLVGLFLSLISSLTNAANFEPAWGRDGMVVTSVGPAAASGQMICEKFGNAFDAVFFGIFCRRTWRRWRVGGPDGRKTPENMARRWVIFDVDKLDPLADAGAWEAEALVGPAGHGELSNRLRSRTALRLKARYFTSVGCLGAARGGGLGPAFGSSAFPPACCSRSTCDRSSPAPRRNRRSPICLASSPSIGGKGRGELADLVDTSRTVCRTASIAW